MFHMGVFMRFLPLISFSVLVMSGSALADEIMASSELKSATVFTNRAKLVRQAVVDVPAGAHSVVFEGLTQIMLTDSIRVEGSADADVKFGSVTHKLIHTPGLSSEREEILQAKILEFEKQIRLVDAERDAVQAQKLFLQNIGRQANLRSDEAIAELHLNSGDWVGAGDALGAGLIKSQRALVEMDDKRRVLNEQLNVVRKEMNQLRTGNTSTYRVEVPLESSAATKLTVDLSYQVTNATWHPIYDARLDTDNGDLELTQYGVVTQRTGEDWSNVALTLSTAQPHRNATLGQLSVNWVDLQRHYAERSKSYGSAPAQKSLGALSLMDSDENYELAEEVAAAPMVRKEKKASFNYAQIEVGGFASEYKIPGPSTVKADGSESKLAVGQYDMESELQIHVRPQLSRDAFLAAHTVLKSEAPVLAGQVSLFRDGAYIGQTYIPMLSPSEEHDFYFGIDDMVRVKRETLKSERTDAGVIMRDNVLERHFVTEIENLHKDSVKVILQENTPVVRNDSISAEILRHETTAGYEKDVDDVKGLLQWTFDVPMKEASKVKLGYKVTWPKGENISGL